MPNCTYPAPTTIENKPNCLNGGITLGAVISADQLDLAAMKDDTALFDKTCNKVLGFAFVDAAVKFNLVYFDKKESTYSSEFTEDTGLYTHTINLFFKGMECEQSKAIKTWIKNCGVYFMVWGNNCEKGRLFGVEYDEDLDEFVSYEKPMSVSRHKETSGKRGKTDIPIHELDLVAESACPALYTDIPISDFKANYAN